MEVGVASSTNYIRESDKWTGSIGRRKGSIPGIEWGRRGRG